MSRTLTVLLCLGELRGKDEGWDPIISQVLVPRDPRNEKFQWVQSFWGEKMWISPTPDPSS